MPWDNDKMAAALAQELIDKLTCSTPDKLAKIAKQRENLDYKAMHYLSTQIGRWRGNGIIAFNEQGVQPGTMREIEEKVPHALRAELDMKRMQLPLNRGHRFSLSLAKYAEVKQRLGYEGYLNGVESKGTSLRR